MSIRLDCGRLVGVAAVMLAANTMLAATSYVLPWYANPTLTDVTYSAAMVSSLNESAAPLATAWATVASDVNVAGQTIVAKRMSHTDYFRPRLYALRNDGTIVIYTLTQDLSEIKWTTVYSSSDLIARVNHNGGSLATGQTVTAFEVVDKDGETAFVQFDNSSTWQALVNSHPVWTYYAAGETGNPTNVNCITDGRWILMCGAISSGRFMIGNYASTNRSILNATLLETLDLWAGYAKTASGTATFSDCGYSFANAAGEVPRVLVYPSTMHAGAPHNAGPKMSTKCEEFVLISSHYTSINEWSTCAPRNRAVVYLPSVTSVGQYSFGTSGSTTAIDTNFEDVNLPALSTINQYAWQRCMGRGTLTLPSVTTIGQRAFYGCDNMEEVILSADKKSLSSLATKAFSAEGTKGSLRRVTLGCAEGFTLAVTDAFAKQPLEVVTFTGAVPSITAATAWPDTAANTMVFAIPEGVAAWDAIAEVATPLSEAERKACHAAHPDWPIPFGVVAASVFKTSYAQYIAYIGNDTGVSLTVERDAFFNDTITSSADWVPFADGTYPKGATVTLTATPNASGTFVKWYGDVKRDDEANSSITITLDGDAWIYARIVHPWTLAADKKTMSNGNFTVNCSVVNESARTLQVGVSYGSKVGGIYANDDGSGVLDLGGSITLAGDSSQWTVVRMSSGDKAWAAPTSSKVDAFITPSTLASAYANASAVLNVSGSGAYRTIILDEPTATWSWTSDWFCNQSSQAGRMRHLVLRIPNLTGISGRYAFAGCSGASDTKMDWWDLSGLRSVGADSWCTGSGASLPRIPASGTLSLPSFRSVAGTEFQRMANVEGFVLGGKDKATTITNIAANAFAYDTSLKQLVLYASADIAVGATPFSNGRTPDEIVFMGVPPSSSTVFANLFADVTSSDTPRIVRIPKGTMAWLNAAYIDHSPTGAEKALAGDESDKVFGVYRGSDGGTPFVKAVCVWDTPVRGFVISFK